MNAMSRKNFRATTRISVFWRNRAPVCCRKCRGPNIVIDPPVKEAMKSRPRPNESNRWVRDVVVPQACQVTR